MTLPDFREAEARPTPNSLRDRAILSPSKSIFGEKGTDEALSHQTWKWQFWEGFFSFSGVKVVILSPRISNHKPIEVQPIYFQKIKKVFKIKFVSKKNPTDPKKYFSIFRENQDFQIPLLNFSLRKFDQNIAKNRKYVFEIGRFL